MFLQTKDSEFLKCAIKRSDERGRSVMPLDDDQKILDCLDGNWRTISQIRTRLRHRRTDGKLSSTLQRLADTGRIERRALETIAPKGRGASRSAKMFAIQVFRRAMES